MGEIVDITTRLAPSEPTTEIAEATWRAARYYGDICRAGSLALVGERVHTPLRCHRRPKHRRCPGYLEVVRPPLKPDDVDWRCPACGDHGTIGAWRGSDWDLSPHGPHKPLSTVGECVIHLTDDECELLRGISVLDPDLERPLFGGRRSARGIRVAFTEDALDELIGFVAFEANHEPQRRRQKRLDDLYGHLEKALQQK